MKMIEIKAAVTERLASKYPTIEIMDYEISLSDSKPCFYVQIIPLSIINQGVNYDLKNFTVKIHYIPLDETNEEYYLMSDNLSRIFRMYLAVLDRKLSIKQNDTKNIANILYFSFDLSFIDPFIPESDENGYEVEGELMQDLNLSQGEI